jgi:antirestriction protein ArdC
VDPTDRTALLDRLAAGVTDLTDSDRWRRHLALQARFHRYSFRNVVLIATQCPEASQVAGFRAWQRMGRTVRRGERAIWILAPLVRRRSGATDEDRATVAGFRYQAVFDVSQTDGEPLPTVCDRLVGAAPEGAFDRLVGCATALGFTVERCELPGTVNGDCSHRLARLRVEVRNDPAQQVKTLAHELAHAVLHEEVGDRALAELEAESAAFVVCDHLGLDTSGYTFGDVATWAGGGDEAVAGIRSAGERIQRAARTVVALLEDVDGEAAA